MSVIAVALNDSTTRRFSAIEGIFDYAQLAPDWDVHVLTGAPEQWLHGLRETAVDGILTCLECAGFASAASLPGCFRPVVNLGSLHPQYPSLGVDPESVADLALGQLHASSIKRLALVTSHPEDALSRTLARKAVGLGMPFDVVPIELVPDHVYGISQGSIDALADWMGVSESLGIVASCERVAILVKRIADRLGINIPNQVSLVSARDSLDCGLPTHRISAVVEPTKELGFRAARLLHRILRGQSEPTTAILLPADGVVPRDTTAARNPDPAVAMAMRYIEKNAIRGITVSDVLSTQKASRVTFERHFREVLGCSPGEMIREVRLRHAMRLLLTTSDSISEVGQACGFDSISSFSSFFKNCQGISPRHFRLRQGGTQRA
ncbi:helix-turn-helix domain-containing protein [Stieleria varia]|nr:helix-turn-helix domain-containing protein [Stieleria varia]